MFGYLFVEILLCSSFGLNIVSAVTFTNMGTSHSISDQLVAGRHIYTIVTSDDPQTTVTMSLSSSYFEVDSTNDKYLLTKSCLSAGSYYLTFLATHTDSSTDTGYLTINVIETVPILNNLPHTIYVLTSSNWPPTINYPLDIDLGCVTRYKDRCSLSVNPNDLSLKISDGNSITNGESESESIDPSNSYVITAECEAQNGQIASSALTLSVVDTIPTTTTSTTTTTTPTTTTTTPTTTSTTPTTTTTTATQTTTPTTTTTTPTTTTTTPTTTTTDPTTTTTDPTTTTTTPTTTTTTPTTLTTTPTTTTTKASSSTTTAPTAAPGSSQLSNDDEQSSSGGFDSAAGIAGVAGGSIAGVGLAAGAGALLWRALGLRRRLFGGNDNEAQRPRNNQNNRPARNLRNITPKSRNQVARGPPSSRYATETDEPRNMRFNTPSRGSCDSSPSSTSSRQSLVRDFEARNNNNSPPRTSYYHVYHQDASYNLVRPPITPIENPRLQAF